MARATATCVHDTDDEEPYDDRDGTVLGRIHITRTFAGDLDGVSSAELLTARTDAGSAAYVAFDRIRGRLGGRAGSFVLEHRGLVSTEGAVTTAPWCPTRPPTGSEGYAARARSPSPRTGRTR